MKPLQPIALIKGRYRFKQNAIVSAMLDHCQRTGLDLNKIGEMKFSKEDRMQLNQLIGYSVAGFLELDCVTKEMSARIGKECPDLDKHL